LTLKFLYKKYLSKSYLFMLDIRAVHLSRLYVVTPIM